MRSSPMIKNAIINFTKEVGKENEIFPKNWPKTVRSSIIAGQERMLPEIRRALDDDTLGIDMKRAWEYMSKGAQQGYDANSVTRDTADLQKLACLLGIDKQVQHEAKIKLALSIHEEQGLTHIGADVDGSEKFEKTTFVRIDGNAVGICDINQALALANAMIVPVQVLVEGRDNDSYNYLIRHRFRHHGALMQKAQFAVNNHQLTYAEELVLRVCSENSLDADAYASLGNIRIQLGNFTGAAAVFARAMSIKPTFTVAERFVWVLCQLAQIESARELIEQIRVEAIKANLQSLVIAMESHVANAQQVHDVAADSK
jgi:tetratricopeptide (TPR) repeat protein